MLSRMAWSLCTRAFEASQDRSIGWPLRRSLQQFGVVWFWAALAADGRALQVWRDYRREPANGSAPRPLLMAELAGEIPVLAAWSVPNHPKMRGLGLGRIWVVTCPFCRRYHMHAPEEGSRPAHCRALAGAPALYALRYEGDLPRGLWDGFRANMTADKPKLLSPPYRDKHLAWLEAA
jgi:hypothetical protein